MFVELTLAISVGLLSATVTLLSFDAILWGLSAQAPFRLLGVDWSIPGYLVWFALIYAIAGTAITHLLGRYLVGLNFNQQCYEADFRFDLVRVRENGEQIALLKGETAEHVQGRTRHQIGKHDCNLLEPGREVLVLLVVWGFGLVFQWLQ